MKSFRLTVIVLRPHSLAKVCTDLNRALTYTWEFRCVIKVTKCIALELPWVFTVTRRFT